MPGLVERIDEELEILRRAEAARRREEADHLVAPRPGVGMLHHRQQLDVREAHVLHVRDEPLRHLAIGVHAPIRRSLPAAQMHFVDRHRPAQPALLPGPRRHPVRVGPLVVFAVPHDRRGARRRLEVARERVGLQHRVSVGAEHFELVGGALLEPGNERFPVAGLLQHAHRMRATVPAVEVADDVDAAGVWRPHREVHAAHALVLDDARAQLLERLEVGALAEQVKVEVGQH